MKVKEAGGFLLQFKKLKPSNLRIYNNGMVKTTLPVFLVWTRVNIVAKVLLSAAKVRMIHQKIE